MGVWNVIKCWFLPCLVLGIRSSVGILLLPFSRILGKSRYNLNFAQFHTEILRWPLWTHISQLSQWTALWLFRTAPLHGWLSALQFVQYLDPLPEFKFIISKFGLWCMKVLFSPHSHNRMIWCLVKDVWILGLGPRVETFRPDPAIVKAWENMCDPYIVKGDIFHQRFSTVGFAEKKEWPGSDLVYR